MICNDCGFTEKEVGNISLYCDIDGSEDNLCGACVHKRRQENNDFSDGCEDYA